MTTQLQALIDDLAERIRQPVGIDDRRFRAVVYSSHPDEIDSVRRRSIMGRQAPESVTVWLESLGISEARDLVRVPANAELDMVARLCLPLRVHERLLGYLWLTDDDRSSSSATLAAVRASAETLARELFRAEFSDREARGREAAAVRALTAERQDGDRLPAVASATHYAVAIIQADAAGDETDVLLTVAVDRVRRSAAPRHLLANVEDGRAVLVLSGTPAEIHNLAAAMLARGETEFDDVVGCFVTVGVSAQRSDLRDLAGARREAELATRIARSTAPFGPLAEWDDLGVYRALSELVGDRAPEAFIPSHLRVLFEDPDADSLTLTVETYLERGGDAAATSAELFIHRSSLYKRLHRVQEIASVDLHSGSDRLELHLALRLRRLAQRATPVVLRDEVTRQT